MIIALIVLALIALAAVVHNHGPNIYDWPESWASDKAFWNRAPRV